MKFHKGIVVKLCPSAEEEKSLKNTAGQCAFVYNFYLDRTIKQYEKTKKSDGYSQWCKHLASELKTEHEWLKEAPANCLQQSLMNLQTAFKNFFTNVKKGRKPGFPKFKKAKLGRSFRVPKNFDLDYDNNLIRLSKIGWILCSSLDRVKGKVKSITVKQDTVGDWFASILTEVKISTLPKTGKGVGIDLGIKTLMTLSNGDKVENFKWLLPIYKRLANLQRSLATKVKGSKNWEKARVRIAKLWRYIRRRTDYILHEVTTSLVRKYDYFYLEDLAVSKMVAKDKPSLLNSKGRKTLRRNLYHSCFNKIENYLTYKSTWYGSILTLVDWNFASSKLCSCCGWKKKDLTLADRTWTCKRCKVTHDRDENAATNIRNYGRRKRKEGISFGSYQRDLYRNFTARTAVNRVPLAAASHQVSRLRA